MIIGISMALMVAGSLLVILNHTEIPEIPIYIFSGVLLSSMVSVAQRRGFVSHGFLEARIMEEIAVLGLSVLVFYSTSGMVLDPERATAVKSVKNSLFVSFVSFTAVTGLMTYLGLGFLESSVLGVAGAVGSTLMDSEFVREEAEKNHIYGWLTEDMNFFDDLFGIVVITFLVSSMTGTSLFFGFMASMTVILSALLLKGIFSKIAMNITGNESELILLCGIATLISFSWVTENLGLSALAGVYGAGLIMVGTDLGFRVRERFSPINDFFTALSFISIGFLLTVPPPKYLGISLFLLFFVTTLRPVISTLALRIQGYDLRTGFMASFQSAQISEIVVVGALILSPFTQNPLFETIALAFATTTIISHILEDREQYIFERLFSDYELDPEKSSIPEKFENHVIIAGYDWKTQGLEDLTSKQIVAVDYSYERIEEAERKGVYHMLSDLQSQKTWEKLEFREASVIISAVEDEDIRNKIDGLETDAEKILVDPHSRDVKDKLKQMLSKSLE